MTASGHLLSLLFNPSTYPNPEIRTRILTYTIYNTTLFTSIKNTIMTHPQLKQDMEFILVQLATLYPPYYYPTSQLIESYQKRPKSQYITRDMLLKKLILEVFIEPFFIDTLSHSVTTQLVIQLPFKSVLENIVHLDIKLENIQVAGLLMNVTELGDIDQEKSALVSKS